MSEGFRRLALACGAVGAMAAGCLYSWPSFRDTQTRRWEHLYFESQRHSHPAAILRRDSTKLRLLEHDAAPWPPRDDTQWQGWESTVEDTLQPPPPGFQPVYTQRIVSVVHFKDFPPEADQPPELRYLLLPLPPIMGFCLLWGAVVAVGWVLDGFAQSVPR